MLGDFPELLRGIEGVLWEADARTFQFLYVSPQSRTILGYEPEEWIASPTFWADHLHPADRDWAVSFCVGQTGQVRDHEFEYRMIAKDGRVVWLRDLVWVVTDDAGRPARLRGLLTDITRRKSAEQRVAVQHESAGILALAESVDEAIPQLLASLGKRLGLVAAACWRVEGDALRCASTWAPSSAEPFAEAARLLRAAGDEGLRQVIDTGAASWTPEGTRGRLAVPIKGRQRVLGLLELAIADAFRPEPEDVATLEAVSAQIGLFLEREAARRELREGEQRYLGEVVAQRARLNSIIGSVPGIVWEAWGRPDAAHHRTDFVSDRVERMLGYTREEWLATPAFWQGILHPEDKERALDELSELYASGQDGTVEFRWLRKDGTALWAQSWVTIMKDPEGRPLGMRGVTLDVTSRKATEQELERTRIRFEQILEHAGEGIYGVDAEGVTTFMNEAALKLTGLTREQAIGHKLHGVIHHTHTDGRPYPPQECPIYQAAHGGPTAQCNDDVFWRVDGTSFPVEYVTSPIREGDRVVGAVTVFKDVSERRRAQAELERERTLVTTILDQLPAGVVVAEMPSGKLVLANRQVNRILRHEFVLAEGMEQYAQYPAFKLDGSPMGVQDNPMTRALTTGQVVEGEELFYRNAADEMLRLLVNAAPVRDAAGAVVAGVATFIDITPLRQAEAALRERAEELARLTEKLQRSNMELDQFAYVTSHDLKAPLRGIANLSRWIEEDLAERITVESRQHLELLRGRVNRMESLIDAILEYSRIGRVQPPAETVDVEKMLRETVDLISPPPGFRVEVAPDMPTLRTSRTQLQQVFLNLVANAIKHHDRADGVVRIGVEDAGSHWRFTVADDGPGIAPRFHEKVFMMFQTLRPRDTVEGTGVGLALVKKIVESHGGSITLESQEGKGAAFRFTWPKTPREVLP